MTQNTLHSPHKPFLFHQSFDPAPPPALTPEPPPPPEPGYSDEAVALLREQAYAQGLAAGKARAAEDALAEQNALLHHIGQTMVQLGQTLAENHAAHKKTAIALAQTIARKLLPAYIQRHGAGEMLAEIETALSTLMTEPRLVLRLHETCFDAINQAVQALLERIGFAGKMIVLADNTLAPADCRLEWADGGMAYQPGLLWSEIERHLQHHQGEGKG